MPKIRVGREDAQAFVKSLKDFSDTLLPEQRAMLGTILDAVQQDETSGYGRRIQRQQSDGEAEQDDTAGYGYRPPRRDTPSQDDDGRWEGLVEWLAAGEGGEDETEGFSIRKL